MKALQDSKLPKPVKLTVPELEELGVHSGGGVQLTRIEMKQALREKHERYMMQLEKKVAEEPVADQFYPIRCECAVSCGERYNFYPV